MFRVRIQIFYQKTVCYLIRIRRNFGSGTTAGQEQTPVVINLHYVLQFHANGGTNLSRRTMTLLADDNPGIMPKVQRKDYMFDGWYIKQEDGTQVTGDEPIKEAATLYARWTKAVAPAKVSALTLKSKKKGQLQASFQKVKGASAIRFRISAIKNLRRQRQKKLEQKRKQRQSRDCKQGRNLCQGTGVLLGFCGKSNLWCV